MANYCDFNPRLFRPFTSKKVKVFPAMADDWVIIPDQYVSLDGFTLRSEKLKQEVADIDLRRFLRFCAEQGLVIDSLRLQGNFIVGNDRSVYTEDMFHIWRDKFVKRTETIIQKKDAKVGHKYKTPCGMSLIYLGARYISRIQFNKEMNLNDYSKITKVHFVIPELKKESWHATYPIQTMKNKFTVDEGRVLTEAEVDVVMNHYYTHSHEYVVFSKVKPKDYKIGLVELDLDACDRESFLSVLFIESNGKLYSGDGHNKQNIDLYYNDHSATGQRYRPTNDKSKAEGWWGQTDTLFDDENLVKGEQDRNGRSGYYHSYSRTDRPVAKIYRLGIVGALG